MSVWCLLLVCLFFHGYITLTNAAGWFQYVNNMVYSMGSTLTDNALKCARDKVIDPFRRTGVPVTVFVLTDGVSFNGDVLIPPIANELRVSVNVTRRYVSYNTIKYNLTKR